MTTFRTLRRRSLAVFTFSTLALTMGATAALAASGEADITVAGDCDSVDVTSSKDISNVVLQFEDGTTQKLDGLSGRSGTFAGTGTNAGETIATVWVKSGDNKSGDGPGYGERFALATSDCGDSSPDEVGADGDDDEGSEREKAPKGSVGDEATADDDAEIAVSGDCDGVDVTSSKDISNVVLQFEDGTTQKLDGLSGRSGTFAGTGTNAGKAITGIWVKSGNNKSGDGPGYGEFHGVSASGCDAEDTGTTGDDTGTTGDDTGTTGDDTGTTGDDTGTTGDDTGTDEVGSAGTDRDDVQVLGVVLERDDAGATDAGATDNDGVQSASTSTVRAAGLLPNTGASVLAAGVAALGSLGLGGGLLARARRRD